MAYPNIGRSGLGGPKLDAPDAGLRTILMKQHAGARLSDQEWRRLGQRSWNEAETVSEGGQIGGDGGGIVPRQMGAYERGQRDNPGGGRAGGGAVSIAQRAPAAQLTRAQRVAQAQADGSFQGKRLGYNRANFVAGNYMDQDGNISSFRGRDNGATGGQAESIARRAPPAGTADGSPGEAEEEDEEKRRKRLAEGEQEGDSGVMDFDDENGDGV